MQVRLIFIQFMVGVVRDKRHVWTTKRDFIVLSKMIVILDFSHHRTSLTDPRPGIHDLFIVIYNFRSFISVFLICLSSFGFLSFRFAFLFFSSSFAFSFFFLWKNPFLRRLTLQPHIGTYSHANKVIGDNHAHTHLYIYTHTSILSLLIMSVLKRIMKVSQSEHFCSSSVDLFTSNNPFISIHTLQPSPLHTITLSIP